MSAMPLMIRICFLSNAFEAKAGFSYSSNTSTIEGHNILTLRSCTNKVPS
jgi:hypothetical protein